MYRRLPKRLRTWSKKSKKMSPAVDIRTMLHGFAHAHSAEDDEIMNMLLADLVFMQYTGMQDSTGKDIYERDILECMVKDKKIRGVVEWSHLTQQWGIISTVDVSEESMKYLDDRPMKIRLDATVNPPTIIGNVHENPELISNLNSELPQ
jgi:uncharacterized phage protein (TIGR01671 family)